MAADKREAGVIEVESRAHAVHAPQGVEVEESKTYDPTRVPEGAEIDGEDDGGPFWVLRAERPVPSLTHCPDCGRELLGSTGDRPFTVCPVAAGPLPDPCHRDCVVACGQEG